MEDHFSDTLAVSILHYMSGRKMASFALTAARMIVVKPPVAASARAASASAVRVPVAAAPMLAHSVRAVSQRGFVGFAAARVFAPRQQRAAFTMEAAAEDGAAVSGEVGVKLYVGAFRAFFISARNERARRSARAGPSRAPFATPPPMRVSFIRADGDCSSVDRPFRGHRRRPFRSRSRLPRSPIA